MRTLPFIATAVALLAAATTTGRAEPLDFSVKYGKWIAGPAQDSPFLAGIDIFDTPPPPKPGPPTP